MVPARGISPMDSARSADAMDDGRGDDMTAPGTPRTLNGMFWQSDTPDRRVPGHLTLNSRPTLETVGQIFIERANKVDLDERNGQEAGGRWWRRRRIWRVLARRWVWRLLVEPWHRSILPNLGGGFDRKSRTAPLCSRPQPVRMRRCALGQNPVNPPSDCQGDSLRWLW